MPHPEAGIVASYSNVKGCNHFVRVSALKLRIEVLRSNPRC